MLSDMQKELASVLRNSTTGKIQACLLGSLTKASPEQLKALFSMLAPLLSQARVIKHCVRCHLEYSENENHKTACEIDHNEFGESERTVIGYEDMTTTLSCCGISFEENNGRPRRSCILALHTTNPEKVKYYVENDEDDEDDENNENNENR
ncbi:hypothetical protein GALMADRAFT_280214, partial [Galerina marginata CBS 339.88]